jgi:non-canonical (house-cleaning) NTP pyrophosphatase
MSCTHTIAVASRNPVKTQAALSGFEKMFPGRGFTALGLPVPSCVPDQPMSDEQTLTGALNRVNNALGAFQEADYWIGIEGGVHWYEGELAAFAWVVIRSLSPQLQPLTP